MKVLKVIEFEPTEDYGSDELKTSDGVFINFEVVNGMARNVTYAYYIEPLCEHVDITLAVTNSPASHKKYLDELQAHIDSMSDDDDWHFKSFKERNWA